MASSGMQGEVVRAQQTPSAQPKTSPTRPAAPASQGRRPSPAPAAKEPSTKPKRTAPPGPKPRHGLRGIQYRWNCLVGRPDKVPPLGPRDYEALLDRRIRYLANNLQITACFANTIGGASKTTTALYVGSIIASLSDKTICVMPATSSTETSTTALKAGFKPDETVTVSELNRLIARGEVADYRSLSARVPRTPFGLFVISEDESDAVEFGKQQFVENYEAVHSKVDSILLDLGNDTVKGDSVVYEAARRSDVIVYTTTVDKPETLVKLVDVIAKHMSFLSTGDETTDRGRRESQIPLAEKAANAVVVVSKLEGRAKAADYEKFTMRRNGRKASTSIGFTGKIMGIPLDRYMKPPKVSKSTADDIDRMIVADLTKISRATRIAYKELVVKIYEQAAANRHQRISYESGDTSSPVTAGD